MQEVAGGVRVPHVPVELAGKEVPEVEIVQNRAADLESATRGHGATVYHEDNGTKLELESGVSELLPEQLGEMSCDAWWRTLWCKVQLHSTRTNGMII